MSFRLDAARVEAFRRDGFLAPVDGFSANEARGFRAALEAYEASLPPGPVPRQHRRKLHVRLRWARVLVEDPRILDVIESLIGPNILIFNASFFIKEAQSDAIAAWHQDATFFGLEPHEHVTAWVALTDVSVEAGCMQFLPGSHRWGQLRHAPGTVAGSVNNGAQAIVQSIETRGGRLAPLSPGQFSLHHTLVVHDSAANRTADRRIGFGISYIPTHVRHGGSLRMPATLVRGTDRFGHFELEPDPRQLSETERAAAHDRAYERYRAGYDEQILLHERTFA